MYRIDQYTSSKCTIYILYRDGTPIHVLPNLTSILPSMVHREFALDILLLIDTLSRVPNIAIYQGEELPTKQSHPELFI